MSYVLYIDGEPQESEYLDEQEGFRVQVEGGWSCGECGTEDPEEHSEDCKAERGDPGPGSFCNSAFLQFDPEENSVTVGISVGDPRGAFVFTVRKLSDGRLVMHVPYPGMTWEHEKLTPHHEGTYGVGYGWEKEGESYVGPRYYGPRDDA